MLEGVACSIAKVMDRSDGCVSVGGHGGGGGAGCHGEAELDARFDLLKSSCSALYSLHGGGDGGGGLGNVRCSS